MNNTLGMRQILEWVQISAGKVRTPMGSGETQWLVRGLTGFNLHTVLDGTQSVMSILLS